jgi:hypothetical protein
MAKMAMPALRKGHKPWGDLTRDPELRSGGLVGCNRRFQEASVDQLRRLMKDGDGAKGNERLI